MNIPTEIIENLLNLPKEKFLEKYFKSSWYVLTILRNVLEQHKNNEVKPACIVIFSPLPGKLNWEKLTPKSQEQIFNQTIETAHLFFSADAQCLNNQ